MNHTNEDLSVKIVEKERQVREVTTQVQSMQVINKASQRNQQLVKQTNIQKLDFSSKVSYEKHKREMSEKLEKTVKAESEAVGGLQVRFNSIAIFFVLHIQSVPGPGPSSSKF